MLQSSQDVEARSKASGGGHSDSRTTRPFGRRVGDEWRAASRRTLLGIADPDRAGQLAKLFSQAGVLPTLAFSCDHVVSEARQDAYGLIVLDARFVCEHDSVCLQKVRAASHAPIMAIGVLEDEGQTDVDVVLDGHGDLLEVVQQGINLIDATRPVRLPSIFRWGPLELDMARHQGRWNGGDVRLTEIEFRIMEVLALAAGSVVSVEQLGSRVYPQSPVNDRDRLVAHIKRIRKKIEANPSCPQFLLRLRGRGFCLTEFPADDERNERG